MPAAFIGAAHFSMSLSTSLCRYSGDRRSGVTKVAARACTLSCTEGVFIASLVASLRRRTIGSGAPLGMKKAYQSLTSNPAAPARERLEDLGDRDYALCPGWQCPSSDQLG